MTGAYFEDGTSYHFDQGKYRIIFEGMNVIFLLMPEFTHKNRPIKMIADYQNKRFTELFADGTQTTEMFKGMI